MGYWESVMKDYSLNDLIKGKRGQILSLEEMFMLILLVIAITLSAIVLVNNFVNQKPVVELKHEYTLSEEEFYEICNGENYDGFTCSILNSTHVKLSFNFPTFVIYQYEVD